MKACLHPINRRHPERSIAIGFINRNAKVEGPAFREAPMTLASMTVP
jgi:hypothetical protein